MKLLSSASAVAAFLALTGTAWSQEAQKPGVDEVFALSTAIQVPSTGLGANTFFSFDISWFAPHLNRYLLADRNNKSIDVVNPGNNHIEQFVNPEYAGFTGNNDTSGPDGVRVIDKEVWVGDSNTCPAAPALPCDGSTTAQTPGPGRVWVLNASNGAVLPPSPILVGGNSRADELCFDPNNHVVMIASPAETPPYVTFIDTVTKQVKGKLIFDGSSSPPVVVGGIQIAHALLNATGGLEQCRHSPQTGKFYQNVPVVGAGPGGAVAVIDGKTMTYETSLTVNNDNCHLPQGMAIGPNHQIMLGCNGASPSGHRNTVLIDDSGAELAVYADLGGADEVWFNQGDGHYFIPGCNTACRLGTGHELLGVVDSSSPEKPDITVDLGGPIPAGSARRVHSVAASSHTDQVYVPIPANAPGTTGPTLCDGAPIKVGNPTSEIGCIAVFTTKHDDHRTASKELR